jgi:hypothetical protein
MRFTKEKTVGKTYGRRGPKRPKKPHALLVTLIAVATFALWVACIPTVWSAEPSALHILAGYQDKTEIPDSSPAEFTWHYFVGLGYSRFLAEDVSLELAAWEPVYHAGMDNLSASAGLKYYFDHLYVPLDVIYRGDLDSLGFGTGLGLDFQVGDRTILRGQAGPQYLGNSDIEDRWTWSVGASIGWLLGGK